MLPPLGYFTRDRHTYAVWRPIAAKEHRCEWCLRLIPKGSPHLAIQETLRTAKPWGKYPPTRRLHNHCWVFKVMA